MSTQALLTYLLNGESPATPAQIEQTQLVFGEGGPPEHLISSTMKAMSAEIGSHQQTPPIALIKRKNSVNRLWIGGAIALAAAMLLQVDIGDVETTPHTIPHTVQTENFTPKGAEASAPEVSLELAVLSRGSNVERFSSEQTYGLGDSVFFRAGSNSSADVALFHIEMGEVTTLLETTLEQGETDLAIDNAPAQWLFETGDEDAVFLLVSLPSGTSVDRVTQTLNDTLRDGGGDLCESLRMIGCQCDDRAVMVSTE